MEIDFFGDQTGKWFLYDMCAGEYEYELVKIVSDSAGYYQMKMYTTDGHIYPGIAIAKQEFHKHAILLSNKDAMIERLKRGYNN